MKTHIFRSARGAKKSLFEIVSYLISDEYFDLGMALLIQQETFEKGIGVICNAYGASKDQTRFLENLFDFFIIDREKSNGFVIQDRKIFLHNIESMDCVNIAHLNSWDNLYNYIDAQK